jgi:hypothetical protein
MYKMYILNILLLDCGFVNPTCALGPNLTTYVDLQLQGGVRYYYVVQTFDVAGAVSGYSAEASAIPASGAIFLPVMER